MDNSSYSNNNSSFILKKQNSLSNKLLRRSKQLQRQIFNNLDIQARKAVHNLSRSKKHVKIDIRAQKNTELMRHYSLVSLSPLKCLNKKPKPFVVHSRLKMFQTPSPEIPYKYQKKQSIALSQSKLKSEKLTKEHLGIYLVDLLIHKCLATKTSKYTRTLAGSKLRVIMGNLPQHTYYQKMPTKNIQLKKAEKKIVWNCKHGKISRSIIKL